MADEFMIMEIKKLEAEIAKLTKALELMAERLSGVFWYIDGHSGEVGYDTPKETKDHFIKEAEKEREAQK